MAKTESAQVLEAYKEVVAASAKGQQDLLAPERGSLYQNVMQESYKTLLSMAPPLHLQAGFPIQKSELLARLEQGPQAWAPELPSSNEDAEDKPAKLQLTGWPEPGTWWNSYRSPVSVPSSDSSASDNESSSEKEEERNVKQEGLRITKPRAALLGKCELKQEGFEPWPRQQPGQPQGSVRMPLCWTSEKDRGLLKSRKRKKETDPGKNRFVCPQCGNSFSKKSSLNRHVATIHDGAKLYEWPPCRKSFLEKSNGGTRAAKRRMRTPRSGREPYECPECGESFLTSASFTKHRRSHSNETTFQCPACDRSYIEERYLVKHLMTAHSGAHLFKCPDCGKGFLGEGDLSMHQTMMHGGGGFHPYQHFPQSNREKLSQITHQTLRAKQVPSKCPECEKSFAGSRSLANHWRIHKKEKLHKDLIQKGSDTEEYVHKCPDCGKHFKAEKCFVNHRRSHGKEQQHQQPVKEEILKGGAQNREIHVETKHNAESACGKPLGASLTQPKVEMEEALHSCPDCGKIFRDSRCFANHRSMHIKEGTSDSAAGEEMVEERKLPLVGQQEGHLKEKPYQCSSCGKSYATQYNLNRHQYIHTDSRPYKCTICGKTFAFRYSLALHEASHTEGRACQHKCSFCGNGFTTKTSLSRHLQLHMKGGRYQCGVCGKAFAYRYSLTHHLEIHVQGQVHKCLFCFKVFRTNHSLNRHKRIHMETRSYQCSVCGKAFGTKYSFCRHQEMHLNGSLRLSSSGGQGLVDGSISQASDTDENSNNWSDSSTLSGHRAEEALAECSKSAEGSPLANCQSVHVEENSSKGLHCEGTFQDNSVSLQDQASCAAENVSNGTNTSVCSGHPGVHMKELPTEFSNRVDSDILSRHQSTHLKENSIKGLDGGETFRDHSVVTREQDSHAEENVLEGTYNLAYPRQEGSCTEDSLPESSEKREGFTASSTLTKHQNIHKRVNSTPGLDRDDPCKDSSTHSSLQGVPTDQRKHTCSNCGKSCRDRYSLKRHERTHTSERPYQCPKCEKRFRETKNLIRHQITHTDLRPYPCAECGKHFKSKSTLCKHQKVHKKPFSCSHCGKRLTTSTILKNHLKMHTEERPFKCTECGKDYKTKGSFNKHREGHFKENSSEVPKADQSNQIF